MTCYALTFTISRALSAASAPHLIANAFKNVLAVAVSTDITFKQAEKTKEYLKDPSKFAVAAAPAAPVAVVVAPTAAAAKPPPKKKTTSDEDMGFGLFD